MSTSIVTPSLCSAARSSAPSPIGILPLGVVSIPGTIRSRWTNFLRGGPPMSLPLPFGSISCKLLGMLGKLWPFVIGCVESIVLKEFGKGRVRRRSAREYWCIRKYICASQKASFLSPEINVHQLYIRCVMFILLTSPAQYFVPPECCCIVKMLPDGVVPPQSHPLYHTPV